MKEQNSADKIEREMSKYKRMWINNFTVQRERNYNKKEKKIIKQVYIYANTLSKVDDKCSFAKEIYRASERERNSEKKT